MVKSHTGLEERGNQLRSDIRELYSSMKRNKTLRANVNDISDFLRVYIPEGISFDDAEQILRSAGLQVLERPDMDTPDDPLWPNRSDRYDVIATMLLPGELMSRAELMLGLRPKSPGDFSAVKEVRAAIIVTFP